MKEGPLKGVTVDHRKLAEHFCENIGWEKETLIPIQTVT